MQNSLPIQEAQNDFLKFYATRMVASDLFEQEPLGPNPLHICCTKLANLAQTQALLTLLIVSKRKQFEFNK